MEQESLYTIRTIQNIITEIKPDTIVLLGDLAGYDDTILEHSDFYASFLNLFMQMRIQTKGKLFSVRGNHDFGAKTEWDILTKVCGLKNPKYIDLYKDNVRTTRMHFLNYGEEESEIDFLEEKDLTGKNRITNIVFGHDDYYVEGATTWCKTDNPTELCKLHNLKGVSTLISGHIHTPVEEPPKTTIDGEPITLVYPGSMSRAANTDDHDFCYYLTLEHADDENTLLMDGDEIRLKPIEEILNPKTEKKKTVEDIEEEARQEEVDKIVRSLGKRRTIIVDVFEQIDSQVYSVFSKESRELAKKTYQEAKNTVSAK